MNPRDVVYTIDLQFVHESKKWRAKIRDAENIDGFGENGEEALRAVKIRVLTEIIRDIDGDKDRPHPDSITFKLAEG